MNISDIVYSVNTLNLSDTLPIKLVECDDDKVNYTEQGYPVGYTCQEFAELFPSVDVNNVYYVRNSIGNQMIYMSLKDSVVLALPIYNKQSFISDAVLSKLVERSMRFSKEKDYANLLFHTPDGAKMFVLNRLALNEEIPTLYGLFLQTYATTDYGFNEISKDTFKKIVKTKTAKQKEVTEKQLKLLNLPEEVTVYRGEGSRSNPYSEAYSWTLNPNVANFFACRLDDSSPRLIKAKVKKENIVEYLEGEEEVIVNPDNVYDTQVLNLLGMDNLSEVVPKEDFNVLFDRYEKYSRLVMKLYQNKSEGIHGEKHSLRVLFLALVIVALGNFKLTEKEYGALCKAIAYHDTGRISDNEDVIHGFSAVSKYEEDGGKEDLTKFLIAYHCIEDNSAYDYLEDAQALDKGFLGFETANETDFVIAKYLYTVLKDADALDRVRTGIRDLDLSYLRNPVSHLLTPTAVSLQKINMM